MSKKIKKYDLGIEDIDQQEALANAIATFDIHNINRQSYDSMQEYEEENSLDDESPAFSMAEFLSGKQDMDISDYVDDEDDNKPLRFDPTNAYEFAMRTQRKQDKQAKLFNALVTDVKPKANQNNNQKQQPQQQKQVVQKHEDIEYMYNALKLYTDLCKEMQSFIRSYIKKIEKGTGIPTDDQLQTFLSVEETLYSSFIDPFTEIIQNDIYDDEFISEERINAFTEQLMDVIPDEEDEHECSGECSCHNHKVEVEENASNMEEVIKDTEENITEVSVDEVVNANKSLEPEIPETNRDNTEPVSVIPAEEEPFNLDEEGNMDAEELEEGSDIYNDLLQQAISNKGASASSITVIHPDNEEEDKYSQYEDQYGYGGMQKITKSNNREV